MIALLLAAAILAQFTLVGRAVLALARSPAGALQSWLMAPVTGFSLQILLTGILNEAGWPVGTFAMGEMLASTILAVGILLWRKPRHRLRVILPFAAVAGLVLLWTGWPAFSSGLNWISYANDDMANYCLAAVRHLHHGFFDRPTMPDLQGLDYSQYYWFMHVGGLIRYGSEILLALVAGCTGLSPAQVFMPTVLALAASMPLAVAALARAGGLGYRTALGAAVLLAMSPLFLLGTYYQLIAQVAGLGQLCVVTALLLPARPPVARSRRIAHILVTSLLVAGLCVTYPEVTPFAGLAFGFHLAVLAVRQRQLPWRHLQLAMFSGLAALVWLRYDTLLYLNTVLGQAGSGTEATAASNVLFPYYLVPSGLANLFGLLPLAASAPEPYFSAAIVTGFGLLLAFAVSAVHAGWQARAHGSLAFVMLALGGLLFVNRSDFGLFKLAMFCQPVLAIAFATILARLHRFAGVVIAVLLGAAQLPSSWQYADYSCGRRRGGFAELPEASQLGLKIPWEALNPAVAVRSDISHIAAAKLAAGQLTGSLLLFPSRDFFTIMEPLMGRVKRIEPLVRKFHPHADAILGAPQLWMERNEAAYVHREVWGTRFAEPRPPAGQPAPSRQLRTPESLEIFNGWARPAASEITSFFSLVPDAPLRPRLSFVHSSRGQHYYIPEDRHRIAFFSTESDFYSPANQFAAVGSFMLFQVHAAQSENIYLRISLTKSLLGRQRTSLYQNARVMGRRTAPIPYVGAGAANLFIGPLLPIEVAGVRYLAVDLGEEGRPFSPPRQNAMRWFNQDILLDPRLVTAFARDFSAVSETEYLTMERPRTIHRFPTDLAEARALEFSGWFEDGWISPDSLAVIAPAQTGEVLRMQGEVPGFGRLLAEGQNLTVTLNGITMPTVRLAPGRFDLRWPIAGGPDAAATRIELHFSTVQELPSPDDRPIAAKIDFLGLVRD